MGEKMTTIIILFIAQSAFALYAVYRWWEAEKNFDRVDKINIKKCLEFSYLKAENETLRARLDGQEKRLFERVKVDV